jgi:hypothetical protein
MHKTGSSSIQSMLSQQPVNPEFEYLKLGKEHNHSTFIYNLFSERPELYHCNIQQGLSKNQVIDNNKTNLERFKTVLKASQAKSVIISGEDISLLNENELCNLKDFLLQHCQSIQVIGYVRPPIAYLQSLYQQFIRGGQVTNIRIENLVPSYKNKFENFDKAFGNKNVCLLKYDSSTLLEKDVVLDFCQHAGITIATKTVARDNESISLEAASLLYTYHKLGFGYGNFPGADRENHLLIAAIAHIGNKKICFSSNLAKSLLAKNLEDIQWMETRLGCSLNESLADSNDGISSEEDLITLGIKYAEDLKQLLFDQIQQQPVTAQKVADWMHILRQQLSNSKAVAATGQPQASVAFSATQIARLTAKNLQMEDMLKELVLSLGRAGHKEAAANVISKLMLLIKAGDKIAHNPQINLSFSVDLFQNGYMMGWILDKSNPLLKLTIELRCIHGIIGKGVADQFRQDLANGEKGDGHCAFKVKVASEMKDFGEQIIIRVLDYDKEFSFKTSSIKGID